jgi:hypothetical protein
MTEPDPFEHDDAAYVLGALSPADTVAFETHLKTCAGCAARVREIQDVPDLLAGVTMADLAESPQPAGSPPDTLLPGLLRRAAIRRRRERGLIAGLAAVAAACLIALIVVAWPTSSSPAHHTATAAKNFIELQPSPVRATATLTAKAWGTGIDVHCHYVPGSVDRSFGYTMVVYGTHNRRETVGSWKLPPDRDIDFPAGTWLPKAQITKIEITLPNGTPVLRLTT